MSDICFDEIRWETVALDSGGFAIRPRDEPLPLAASSEVLLNVRNGEAIGDVRLPPPSMVATGFRYGSRDSLVGTLQAGDHMPQIREIYRVVRIGRIPGQLKKILQIEKIARPI